MSDEFRVVSDELRSEPTRHAIPTYDALTDGKTVFIPLNGTAYHALGNRIRNAMRYRGKVVTTRHRIIEDQEGILAWVTGDVEKAAER